MRIGFLLPSIYMNSHFGKGRIFAPGDLGISLVNGLVQKGHEVFFYASKDTNSKARLVPGIDQLLDDPQTYYIFRNRTEDEKKYTTIEVLKRDFEYNLTLKAYQDAASGKLDIIHSYHDFGAHYFNELSSFPTVYTLHDPMPPSSTIEYNRLLQFPDHNYISITNAQRKNFPIHFLQTVYHGLNMASYEFNPNPQNYLIHFGRIMEDKGSDVAIQVAKAVNVPLHIATSTVRANRSEEYFDSKIKPFIDGKHVTQIGFLSEKEKSDYIGGGIAFLFPLQWEEPFGMVLIEAMSCGTPVIAYNRGGISEIVRDGVTGFVIDPDDEDRPGKGTWVIKQKGVEGLIEAVNRIKEIDRMATRKHVEQHFSVEKMVSNYEKVYEKALSF